MSVAREARQQDKRRLDRRNAANQKSTLHTIGANYGSNGQPRVTYNSASGDFLEEQSSRLARR